MGLLGYVSVLAGVLGQAPLGGPVETASPRDGASVAPSAQAVVQVSVQPSVLLSVIEDPSHLESFLVERMQTAGWNLERPTTEPPGGLAVDPQTFGVRVHGLGSDQVHLRITLGDDVLTDRTLEHATSEETMLTLWLLIKSSVDRGRIHAYQEVHDAKDDPAHDLREPAATAGKKAVAPSKGASGVLPGRQPSRSSAPVAHRTPLAPPPHGSLAPNVLVGLLASVWLETPKLLAPGIQVALALEWAHTSLGLQAGYRYAPGPDGLEVHGVPVGITAAVGTGDNVRVALGGMLNWELKIPVSGGRDAVDVGADGGLFTQASIPLSPVLRFDARFGLVWRILRMEVWYLDSSGSERRLRESPWTTFISVGASWQ